MLCGLDTADASGIVKVHPQGVERAPGALGSGGAERAMETSTTGLRGLNLIRQQIREFIAQNFFYGGSGGAIPDDMPLVERGGLDQTGVLEIALFIEETYGAQVDEMDLTPENFDTVDSIARFVYMRMANT